MMNVDHKVLTLILAERLNECIENYIMEDQAGFFRGHYLKDNVKKVMNIMEQAQKFLNPRLLCFLGHRRLLIEWSGEL